MVLFWGLSQIPEMIGHTHRSRVLFDPWNELWRYKGGGTIGCSRLSIKWLEVLNGKVFHVEAGRAVSVARTSNLKWRDSAAEGIRDGFVAVRRGIILRLNQDEDLI
jgi:hypothetical protein